jgi:tyrosyl-tRNA synthetase
MGRQRSTSPLSAGRAPNLRNYAPGTDTRSRGPMSTDEQLALLMRGVDTVVPGDGLRNKLEEDRPLRVKLGLDPTAPSVTLGWAVVLRKLRHFQELGHVPVLIVGDFTARVGDPSGRNETRKALTVEEVDGFAAALLEQFSTVIDMERVELRRNSEWLGALDMADVLRLTSHVTVAQMLEREDFALRFGEHRPISLMEFMYPLLQGMDSVAIEADIELGGTDQLWNLMMGRHLQQRDGQAPQVAMTMPLLVGTDGVQKMSQSLGNYIGVTDPPAEMFGRTMSIPDALLEQWFLLATEVPADEVSSLMSGLAAGSVHPGDAKRRLGREIVTLYHGSGAASAAEVAFDALFRRGEIPEDVPTHRLGDGDPIHLPALLHAAGLTASNGEARRLLSSGAVRIDGARVDDLDVPRRRVAGAVVQVGKRRFVKFV